MRSTGDLLNEFADLVANTGSQQERAALPTAAFGRTAGSELIPLLSERAAGLARYEAERLGIISAEQAAAAAEANGAIDRLSRASGLPARSCC